MTFESEESVEKIVKERFVLLNGKQVGAFVFLCVVVSE